MERNISNTLNKQKKFYAICIAVFFVSAIALLAVLKGSALFNQLNRVEDVISVTPEPLETVSAEVPFGFAIFLAEDRICVVADEKTAQGVIDACRSRKVSEVPAGINASDVTAEYVIQPVIQPVYQSIPLQDAAAAEEALSKASTVRIVFFVNDIEYVKKETVEKKDGDLLSATRIVTDFGQDGIIVKSVRYVYENGEKVSEEAQPPTILREMIPMQVLEGTLKRAKSGAIPSKGEGKKGRDHQTATFLKPVESSISLYFGGKNGGYHYGLDFKTAKQQEVKASAGGVVVAVMERGSYGLMVEIDHGDGFTTRYAKLGEALVEVGNTVEAGDAIALTGEEHLHFELRIDGRAYNPQHYFA